MQIRPRIQKTPNIYYELINKRSTAAGGNIKKKQKNYLLTKSRREKKTTMCNKNLLHWSWLLFVLLLNKQNYVYTENGLD